MEEITKTLEVIDKGFSESNVPIHQRPIRAIIEFGKIIKLPLPIVSTGVGNNHPDYYEHITNAIHNWYKEKYGELLNIDFSPGKTIVDVSGNPLILELPLIRGRAIIVWDANGVSPKDNNDIKLNEPVVVNVANRISGMTEVMAKGVAENESQNIIQWFALAMDVYEFLCSMSSNKLLHQSRSDLLTSVMHIKNQISAYGQSKWSSLQACEKFIKALISAQGHTYPRHHNLLELAKLASLTSNNQSGYLENIQCTPGVRYGEKQINISDAVLAHKSAMMFMHSTISKWPG